MISIIEKNYFKINLVFLSVISFYCMAGLIVPLQFISANKFVTLGMTLMGVLLGLYNFFVKKAYLFVRKIEYLILFFAMNIITSLLVIKYGFSTNIKNLVVFFIYFFAIYPIFQSFSKEKSRLLFNLFFSVITVANTVGVFISLVQFLMLIGYRVFDYKGLLIRQGFVESRLFGILASPNYLSIISLIIIIYLGMRLTFFSKLVKTLAISSILLNFAYIVLSGSRTTYICLVVAAFLYSLVKFEFRNKLKSFVAVLLTVGLVFLSYNGVKYSSDLYLKAHSAEIQLNKEKGESNNLTLERTDTSEENISNNRFAIWQSTASFIPKRPLFGYSAGNWYELGKTYDASAYIIKEHYLTHNGYLELLFYNGILGFLPFAAFMISFIWASIKKFLKDKKDKITDDELVSGLLMTVVILISNLFLSSTLYGISLLGCILFIISGYYFSVISKKRDGYRQLNEEEIKEIELGVMDYIHNLCEKENINYSLAYGTLLGAVRHKGYIPWDDDIDISLKRDEYDKLYQAVLRDNDPIYKVASWENDARYPYPFYRVYDARTVYENNYIENDIDLGICVDVFPFDYYADVNKEMVKLDTYRRLSVYTLYGIHSKNAGLKNIIRYLLVLVFRLTRVKTWNKKMNLLSMQANDNDSIDYLMENKRTSTKFEKTLLDKVMDSPFEDRTYKIPEASHQILSAIYGDDFMEIPPVEKRVKHDNFIAYIKEV
ncbi:lipopolysaccharide cholinephosphotransferase [Streptococcus sp. oral taxon 431]|uniref:LicD family protein n=1 Tax=Streptococcus sp. oral taxon 431 TaxID=712633 RepID=UPI000767FC42|nr:LicD family protein [Streptococcus sp. oral taxon 431]AMD96710.1 lipopolysaccharide cholinephosphotransferase [Streptococcus sp. oral taxon 431]